MILDVFYIIFYIISVGVVTLIGLNIWMFFKWLLNVRKASKFTNNLESGLFVRHVMVFDEEDGLPVPQKTSTKDAYKYL